MSNDIFEKVYSSFTEKWIEDFGGLDYDEAHCYAQSVFWEYAMDYIQKNFHGVCEDASEISDCKNFYERFMDFARILFMTEDGAVEGEYLRELLEGKQLWKNKFDEGDEYVGVDEVDELAQEHRIWLHQYIKSFGKIMWNIRILGGKLKKRRKFFG